MAVSLSPAAVNEKSKSPAILPFVLWPALLLLAAFAIREMKPPDALASSAAQDQFSAERAMVHVQSIAGSPHPIGSANNVAVRNYLVSQLSSLGTQPQVFSAVGVHTSSSNLVVANVNDVLARIPGTANSRAVLLMAHYDSVNHAPGAADDGASVAAILETIRAIKAGPPLKNDLIVLLTDGEEVGLLGAEAFVASHPWMKDVGMIMNFEARGDQGPSLLFETSNNNRALLENVAQSAPAPIGSSLFYTLYKMLPNDTDFTVFRPSRIPGLNFAYGENFEAYHTQLDSPANLSTASLQHHGSYALALSRQFGQMDLTQLQNAKGDDVFFNWFGAHFIIYSESWILPSQIVATLLLILTVTLGLRTAQARGQKVFLGVLACLAILVVVPAVLWLTAWAVGLVLAGHNIVSDSPANAALLVGYVFIGAAVGGSLLGLFRRWVNVLELSLAGTISIGLVSWAVALKLPGGSYLLFWPLLFMILSLLAIQLMRKGTQTTALVLASLAGTVAAIFLFAPVAYLLYIFLTLQPLTVIACGALLGIFFITCVPFISAAVPQRAWSVVVVLLVAGVAGLTLGITRSQYTPEHPRRDNMIYSFNADNHSARWISYDQGSDPWTSQFFKSKPQRGPVPDYLFGNQRAVLSAPATETPLTPPVAEVKADQKEGDLHKLQLTVKSPRNADMLYLGFDKSIQPVSVKAAGRDLALHQSSGGFGIWLFGMGDKETELQITVRAPSGVSFWLMDQSNGLPGQISPRPNGVIAGQASDLTIIDSKYTL